MKKFLLSLIFGGATLAASAQCSELFISEYVEGSYNNKALELYNPTNAAIDLSAYRIVRWSNGQTDLGQLTNEILPLTGTIAAKDVFVIVINTQDVGTDTVPFADLVAKADVQLCTSCDPNSSSLRTMCFNGDDALSLQKNNGGNWDNVDIFALIGERPTNGNGGTSPTGAWTNLTPYATKPANIQSNVYFLYYWTQDQTMVRKSSVTSGQATNPGVAYTGAWNPATQWDTLPENTFTQLGAHVCDCNTIGVSENPQGFAATIYPNPAVNTLNVVLTENIKGIEVYNTAGQLVMVKTVAEPTMKTNFDITHLTAGLYLVRVETTKGHTAIKKITKQ